MGAIRLYGSTSGYLELQAPAVAPDAVLTLPSDSVQPGLVHLHTETFSAVSSVSIDNVFTSTYENYKILYSGTHTNVGQVFMRLRVSGTDATSSNYDLQYLDVTGTTVSGGRLTQTGLLFSYINTGNNPTATDLTLFGPQIAANTYGVSHGMQYISGLAYSGRGHEHTLTTSYDGLTVYPSAGTMTGTIRIYGYRNS